MENKFTRNQLLLPNGILEVGFFYNPDRDILDENINYVAATPTQVTHFRKYILPNMEKVDKVDDFMSKGRKKSNEYETSRKKELDPFINKAKIYASRFKNGSKGS